MSVYLSNTELLGKHYFSHLFCWASAMVQFSDLPLKQTLTSVFHMTKPGKCFMQLKEVLWWQAATSN